MGFSPLNISSNAGKTQEEIQYGEVIRQFSQRPENQRCADCKVGATEWASWNLGVFLCIQCAGVHRGLGTHISKVKSIALDAWSFEQLQSMQRWGNTAANAYWEQKLGKPFTPNSNEVPEFIRDKYVKARYVAGAIPPVQTSYPSNQIHPVPSHISSHMPSKQYTNVLYEQQQHQQQYHPSHISYLTPPVQVIPRSSASYLAPPISQQAPCQTYQNICTYPRPPYSGPQLTESRPFNSSIQFKSPRKRLSHLSEYPFEEDNSQNPSPRRPTGYEIRSRKSEPFYHIPSNSSIDSSFGSYSQNLPRIFDQNVPPPRHVQAVPAPSLHSMHTLKPSTTHRYSHH